MKQHDVEAMLFRRTKSADDARHLVEEAEREIEAIRRAIRVDETSNAPVPSQPKHSPDALAGSSKPAADRTTLAGRLALLWAS